MKKLLTLFLFFVITYGYAQQSDCCYVAHETLLQTNLYYETNAPCPCVFEVDKHNEGYFIHISVENVTIAQKQLNENLFF